MLDTPTSNTGWRLGGVTVVATVALLRRQASSTLNSPRLAAAAAAAAFCLGWTGICLGYNAVKRALPKPTTPTPRAVPLRDPPRIQAEAFTAAEFAKYISRGQPFVVEGLERLPELKGKFGMEGFVAQLGHVPVLPENSNAGLSTGLGDLDSPTLADVCAEIVSRAEAGEDTNLRVHGLLPDPPLDKIYEHPRDVYESLSVRRGGSHHYVGSQGASVFVHWDQEQNHNLHTVLVGTRRIILTPESQTGRMYQQPGGILSGMVRCPARSFERRPAPPHPHRHRRGAASRWQPRARARTTRRVCGAARERFEPTVPPCRTRLNRHAAAPSLSQGYTAGAPDFDAFPEAGRVDAYEVLLSAGQACYMPARCWHYIEYHTPCVAQTLAFYTSDAARRRALGRQICNYYMQQWVPQWFRRLQFYARNPECTASQATMAANLVPPPNYKAAGKAASGNSIAHT